MVGGSLRKLHILEWNTNKGCLVAHRGTGAGEEGPGNSKLVEGKSASVVFCLRLLVGSASSSFAHCVSEHISCWKMSDIIPPWVSVNRDTVQTISSESVPRVYFLRVRGREMFERVPHCVSENGPTSSKLEAHSTHWTKSWSLGLWDFHWLGFGDLFGGYDTQPLPRAMQVALQYRAQPRLPFSEAGFDLNPVDVIAPVRNSHFSLQKCMVMQPDINLMRTFQKPCHLSVLHLCAFLEGAVAQFCMYRLADRY